MMFSRHQMRSFDKAAYAAFFDNNWPANLREGVPPAGRPFIKSTYMDATLYAVAGDDLSLTYWRHYDTSE